VDWETLLAGLAGLTGGFFAYLAAHNQIRSNRALEEERRKRLANAHRMKLISVLDSLTSFCLEQKSVIQAITQNITDIQNAKLPEFKKLGENVLGHIVEATQHETLEIQDSLQKALLNLRFYHEETQRISDQIEHTRKEVPALVWPLLTEGYRGELKIATFNLIEAHVFIAKCFEIMTEQNKITYVSNEITEEAYVSSALKLTSFTRDEAQKYFKNRLKNIS